MTWRQGYLPLGGLLPSTLVAAIPLVTLLGSLGLLRLKAHRAQHKDGQSGDTGQGKDRIPHRAECYRSGVSDQRQRGGLQGPKSQTNQHRGGNGHRCAKSCGSFDESAETKSDQQGLNPSILHQT
jgi:hypothetical protein